MLGATDSTYVDTIEQHGQLGGVHLDRATVVSEARSAKSAALKPLVIENEAATVPKQDFATVTSTPQKHEQMPGEQVHTPLPTDNAAQAVVATTKIDGLDCEIDPNTRRQREQRLPQPANHSRHVRGVAAFLETKSKLGTELELDLLDRSAADTHRQHRESLAFRRCRPVRLVQVVLQRGIGDPVLGRDFNARNHPFSGLRHDGCPKFCSTCR